MKPLIIGLVLLAGLCCNLRATEQEFEFLIVEGAVYFTNEMPPIKVMMPDVKHPDYQMVRTSNWAGYIASWAVIDKQLYLIGVEGTTKDTNGSRMLTSSELYPKLKFPVKITEFTGSIALEGRSKDYVIDGDIKTYSDKINLSFKNGILIESEKKTRQKKL